MPKICFIGNMNNFPFGIAKEFKKMGYDVTQFIDVPKEYLLDRPESENDNYYRRYPDWIVDLNFKSTGIIKNIYFLFPNIFFRALLKKISKFDIVFLNGSWIRLGKYISGSKLVIGLLAGNEVDGADQSLIDDYLSKLSDKSFFIRLIPKALYKLIHLRLIKLQQLGIKRLDVINYYLPGVNSKGDKIISEIKNNQNYSRIILRGFDTSLFKYCEPDLSKKEFNIVSVTRFTFTNNAHDNKRNDIMLKGISDFIKANNIDKGLKIIFFDKGEDVAQAKLLCEDLGLSKYVTWVPQVPLSALTHYFSECDVAFDQLGNHWVGAGLFSMLSGRPLIANGRPELYEKYVGEIMPVCHAINSTEVQEWLTKLYNNRSLIKTLGISSRNYVLKHYDISQNMNFYCEQISKHMSKKSRT